VTQPSFLLRSCRIASAVVVLVALAAACGDDDDDDTSSATSTTQDPIAAAQDRVSAAETALADAEDALVAAGPAFCDEAEGYIEAIDRYGKLFTDSTATVGDVRTLGTDLTAPRESVASAASAVSEAQAELAAAEQELADAQRALAEVTATTPSPSTTTPPTTTSTTVVPPATINRVRQAEEELAATGEGITDATPLVEAAAEYNSAAFALEIAWLRLLADAGCLTDEQQAEAAAQVADYTVALQTQLQLAGYYAGPIDGIYGPQTVEAVKHLQTDSGLPTTGTVDAATARALDEQLAALGEQAAAQARAQTAAVQTVLTLTGHWTGPIDGEWTDELTEALKAFQIELGVEPTGAVDAATLAAFEEAVADLRTAVTTTTTSPPATTASPPTTTAPTDTT
jgi:peptidoglycan hydrolase-like protein with peptidoglycan-binding domain